MKIGGPRFFQRSVLLAAACMLALVLTACTGKGGGYLPPSAGFTGQASFGFTFSCEKGDLKIELSYNDKGSNLQSSARRSGFMASSTGRPSGLNPRPVLARTRLLRREQADLLGPLLPDVVGAVGLSIDVPQAGDVDLAAMPLRGHRAGQRPEHEPVHRATSSRSSCPRNFAHTTIARPKSSSCVITEFPTASVVYARAGFLAGGNITVK